MTIEIFRTGNPDWPRYLLAQRTGSETQYWTGSGWTADFSRTRLYALLREVCREFDRLKAQGHEGQLRQVFEAKVTVTLEADCSLSQAQVARFLNRFAELYLPTEGPTEDSWLQAEIHWHELHKTGPKKSLGNSDKENGND